MRQDDATILDILSAAQLVVEFTGGMEKPEFLSDAKTQSAVIHQLLIIGEAVKRLSEDFRVGHPELPWKMIAGMRDKLIHNYDGVDLDEVWQTLNTDVPQLITVLNPLITQNNNR